MIRAFRPDDADELASIFSDSIRALAANDYSPAQLEAWLARAPQPDDFLRRAATGDHIVVATGPDGEAAGFAIIEADAHVDLLYVSPAFARQGHARKLLDACEDIARRERATSIFAEASETALCSFLKAGYEVEKRRDFEIGGVAIHNYAVRKSLR